jgi:hypothetical protein
LVVVGVGNTFINPHWVNHILNTVYRGVGKWLLILTFSYAGVVLAGTEAAQPLVQTSEPQVTQPESLDSMKAGGRQPVFGPDGFDQLKLGMTPLQVRSTGEAVSKPILRFGDECDTYDLRAYPSRPNEVGIYLSAKFGIALISAPRSVHTTEGIGIGSTRSEVRKAYPDVDFDAPGTVRAKVPGNSKAAYAFLFDSTGRVSGMDIRLVNQDCVE